jgi:hypothetical protein
MAIETVTCGERRMSNDEDLLILPDVLDSRAVQDTSRCVKARYVMAFMGFLGFANVYAMRVNLSVAIVAMVNNTAIPKVNDSDSNDVCTAEFTNQTTVQLYRTLVDGCILTEGVRACCRSV